MKNREQADPMIDAIMSWLSEVGTGNYLAASCGIVAICLLVLFAVLKIRKHWARTFCVVVVVILLFVALSIGVWSLMLETEMRSAEREATDSVDTLVAVYCGNLEHIPEMLPMQPDGSPGFADGLVRISDHVEKAVGEFTGQLDSERERRKDKLRQSAIVRLDQLIENLTFAAGHAQCGLTESIGDFLTRDGRQAKSEDWEGTLRFFVDLKAQVSYCVQDIEMYNGDRQIYEP